jgi:hypothetical protein
LLTSSFSASGRLLVYEQQICHEGLNGAVALAVTDNPETQVERTTGMGTRQVTVQRPTQIQICPWFIDFIENNDYKLGNDVAGSNIGRAGIQLSKKYNWPFQEIGTILCKLQN